MEEFSVEWRSGHCMGKLRELMKVVLKKGLVELARTCAYMNVCRAV